MESSIRYLPTSTIPPDELLFNHYAKKNREISKSGHTVRHRQNKITHIFFYNHVFHWQSWQVGTLDRSTVSAADLSATTWVFDSSSCGFGILSAGRNSLVYDSLTLWPTSRRQLPAFKVIFVHITWTFSLNFPFMHTIRIDSFKQFRNPTVIFY